jgi:CRP/FNR family transcriptional regulator, cyclic AMP receptor protein
MIISDSLELGSDRATHERPSHHTGERRTVPHIDPAILRKNHIFGVLNDDEIGSVIALAHVRKYESQECIFSKGDLGSSLFIILQGRVAVTTESQDAKRILLNILDAGAVFGEIALLDGRERTATVVAQEPCELLRLDRKDFMPFLAQKPDICIRLMGVLCERLRWTSAIIEDTVFLNLPRRLAKRILNLLDTYGRTVNDGMRINTAISQENLANMLGVSREIVNKTLKNFQAHGIIAYRGGYLIVMDRPELERMAR